MENQINLCLQNANFQLPLERKVFELSVTVGEGTGGRKNLNCMNVRRMLSRIHRFIRVCTERSNDKVPNHIKSHGKYNNTLSFVVITLSCSMHMPGAP